MSARRRREPIVALDIPLRRRFPYIATPAEAIRSGAGVGVVPQSCSASTRGCGHLDPETPAVARHAQVGARSRGLRCSHERARSAGAGAAAGGFTQALLDAGATHV